MVERFSRVPGLSESRDWLRRGTVHEAVLQPEGGGGGSEGEEEQEEEEEGAGNRSL